MPCMYPKRSNAIATAFCLLVLIVTIGAMCWSFVDGAVRTVENEEAESRRRIYASETYHRPAAYRMQSPTPDQMEAYHHLMQVQEVRR